MRVDEQLAQRLLVRHAAHLEALLAVEARRPRYGTRRRPNVAYSSPAVTGSPGISP